LTMSRTSTLPTMWKRTSWTVCNKSNPVKCSPLTWWWTVSFLFSDEPHDYVDDATSTHANDEPNGRLTRSNAPNDEPRYGPTRSPSRTSIPKPVVQPSLRTPPKLTPGPKPTPSGQAMDPGLLKGTPSRVHGLQSR
jgi:hypothetical protein